jgi:hypothetical protein
MATDVIFDPLKFRNLTVKNRIFRSNLSGRFDNYDGSGNQARINWEVKFARGGAGAVISSIVPVNIQGRILPNYATIDRDERIPFWRELGKNEPGSGIVGERAPPGIPGNCVKDQNRRIRKKSKTRLFRHSGESRNPVISTCSGPRLSPG